MSSRSSLNHIYRTVWNQSLGAMVAVAEIASAGGRSSGVKAAATANTFGTSFGLKALAAGVAIAWGLAPVVVQASPSGGVAVVGQATMSTSGANLLVTTQNGIGINHSAINWQSFSIPMGSSTYFQQPSASSTSINRVVTSTPSQLFGSLGSNGNLVLVNQAGITVGAGAVVDTASFTASSLQMSDADALAGRLRFGGASGSGGAVSLAGTVLARSGDVVLIGSSVDTGKDALVQAPNGATILVAGSAVSISSRGLEGINFDVQAGANHAVNLGTLKGDAVGIFAGTLKHSGQIQAQAVGIEGGKVVLKATELAEISGSAKAAGVNDRGGAIHATADKVWLQSTASLDASAPKGGGEVLVGGGWQGGDARLANAQVSLVSAGANIKVDATERGDAGTAVVWADGATRFVGHISAKGGTLGGNGGNVEVSGKDYLDFRGSADLLAPQGRAGTLLLDPASITIQSAGPVDANGNGTQGDDLAGLSLPSLLGNSVITAGAVQAQLGFGTVILEAPGDIFVNAAISGYGALVLRSTSSGSITTAAPITSSGLALNVTLNATSGNIAVNDLTSNGGTVTLSASGTVAVNGALNAGTGAVSLTGGGGVSLNNAVTSGTLSLSSTNAAINQTVSSIAASSTVTISSGSGNVNLKNTGNSLSQLQISSAGAVDIVDSSANLQLYSVASTGSFKLKAGGNVSISSSITTTSGAIDIQSDQVLTVNSAEGVNSAGGLTLRGSTGLTVSGANLTTNNGGNMLLDSGSGSLSSGVSGGTVTQNGGGVWRTYSPVIGNSFGMFPDLNAAFKQYGATFGSTPQGSGNGRMFTGSAPVLATATTTLTGSISKIYDGSLSIGLSGANFSAITGTVELGDTATNPLISGGTGTLDNANVGTGKFVTASGMTVSGITFDSGKPVYGYQIGSFTGNIGQVTPARAIASINLTGNRVYDGTNIVGASIFSLNGLMGSETLNLSGNGTVADKNVGPNKPVSLGSLALGDGSGLASNYTLSGGTAVATITPATIGAVSGIAAVNKVYDGSAAATVSTAGVVLTGKVGSDVLSVTAGSAAFADKNVGLGKVVNVSGLALVGADAANYSLASTVGLASASIVPKPLIVGAVTVANKVYDGTTAAMVSGGALSGLLAGDNVSLTTPTGTFVDKNVGVAKQVTVGGLALSGTDSSNYSLIGTTASATADITAKALVAGAFSALNKVYDGTRSATVSGGVLTGTVIGDVVTLSPITGSFADKSAGSAKVVSINGLALIGADAKNYTLSTTSGTARADITARVLSASGFVASGKVYDGTRVATVSGGILSGAVAGDNVALGSVTASFTDKNAGVAKLVTVSTGSLSGADAANYSIGSTGFALTADIASKQVSVAGLTALNKVYDGTTAASVAGGVVVGAIAGDAVGVTVASSAFADKNRGTGKAITVSGISLGGADARNYVLATTGTTLSADITPKPLAVAGVTAFSKVYDGTNSASVTGGSLLGAIAGDLLSLGALSGTFLDKNAGDNKPVVVTGFALGGVDAGNYRLETSSVSAVASISRKLLDVSALTASGKVYDGTTLATLSGGALSGAIVGDSIALAPVVGVFADKNVGSAKPVSISGLSLAGADVGNYSLSSTNLSATASITPKPLSVSGITAASKEYDGKTDAVVVTNGAVLSGLVPGDNVTTTAITAAFADKNVGVAKKVSLTGLGLVGVDSGNYTFSSDGVTTADIRVRPSSNWQGGASGLWSDVKNWDVVPEGANVLAVNLPSTVTALTLDSAAGSVSLQGLNLSGVLAATGGGLQVSGSITTGGYNQTSGAVSATGAFRVNGSFDQVGGTLAAGSVEVVRPTGDIVAGNISSPTVSLTAQNGAIRGSGNIQGGTALITKSTSGTLLNSPGNQLSSLTAENLGTGTIELVNTGVLITAGINNTGGNITVVNTGGVTSLDQALITALSLGSKVSLAANSPLTIGASGVQAGGDIVLVATNLTSAGDMTLNGPLESKAGSVTLTAGNNLTQNSSVLAQLGVRATAGGTLTLGPKATSGYQPVSYEVNSVPAVPPRPPTSTSAASDLVVALMAIASDPAGDRTVVSLGNLTAKDKDTERDLSKELIVSEGQVCRP